jgi:methylmalonyl-CoA/ethylmalonyl-CoA epimerase
MNNLVVHHIGFAVKDIHDSLPKWIMDGYTVALSTVDDAAIGVACVLLTDHSGVLIELVAPLPGTTSLSSRLRRGGGLDHICYETPNILDQLEFEEAKGALVIMEPRISILFSAPVAFVLRKTGLLAEFIEIQPSD